MMIPKLAKNCLKLGLIILGINIGIYTGIGIYQGISEGYSFYNPVVIPSGVSNNPNCANTFSCFSPYSITIVQGQTVTWRNDDFVGHTVTSGYPSDQRTGIDFDSSLIKAGGEWSYTFDYVGTYHYFCQVHPWMAGKVVVHKHGWMPDLVL